MRMSLAVALLGIALSADAVGADKNGSFSVIGFGNKSCGAYVERREGRRTAEFADWFTGYVSAFNESQEKTYDLMGATDLEGALAWIENFCRNNPLRTFRYASKELLIELYDTRLQVKPAR